MIHPAKIFDPLVRFALPPRCAGCGVIVADDNQFCVSCWSGLSFLTAQGCTRCGVPMEQEGLVCAPCMLQPPAHDGVRSVVLYDDLSKHVALRLKSGRRIGLARLMGGLMARLAEGEEAALVPVPLHRWRIWSRGFNQSVLIGHVVSDKTGLPLLQDAIVRTKATPCLQGLGAQERRRAVRAAFAVPPQSRAAIKGQRLLLIDDVYTSGATADACAATLKRAGAASVRVLTWARVAAPDEAGH